MPELAKSGVVRVLGNGASYTLQIVPLLRSVGGAVVAGNTIMVEAMIACGCAIIASVECIDAPISFQMWGPQIDSAKREERRTTAPFRSGLFAT